MRRALLFLTVAAMLTWSAPAWAPYHLSVIQQVYFGSADCPDAQFVMMRTLNAFQVRVNGQGVQTQNADDAAGPDFGVFDHNLARTDSGVAMLIGTHALSGCPATPAPTATGIPGGTASATIAPSPTNTLGGPLGVRHFSLDPARSELVATLAPGLDFPTTGFTGFLDLSAGAPDPSSGVTFVDLVDASEYLALSIPLGGNALCLKIDRAQLPVHNAGILACKGGALGLTLTEDRNVGVVGACAGGTSKGLACATNGDCPQSTCFDAAVCTALGGTLEGDDDPFPGVCQGPLVGSTLPGDVGPGALLLAPDPNAGVTKGIPVAIIQETALPCGDEPGAPTMSTSIALTTGTARCTIADYNNQPGATLVAEQTGDNFNCVEWSRENGPGTLVLAAPSLNMLAVNQQPTDIITSFVFVD